MTKILLPYLHPVKDVTDTFSDGFFCLLTNALVAELVDALVSNTNEVTLVPVRLRPKVQQTLLEAILEGFLRFLANHWQTILKNHFFVINGDKKINIYISAESVFEQGYSKFFFIDRKSTRLNSSHVKISYAVF